MTPEQKTKVEEMYARGIGYSTISRMLKIKASVIRRHLNELGLLRSQKEGFDMRRKNFGFNKGVSE